MRFVRDDAAEHPRRAGGDDQDFREHDGTGARRVPGAARHIAPEGHTYAARG
jgi:hypothetical protein